MYLIISDSHLVEHRVVVASGRELLDFTASLYYRVVFVRVRAFEERLCFVRFRVYNRTLYLDVTVIGHKPTCRLIWNSIPSQRSVLQFSYSRYMQTPRGNL